MIDQRWKRPDRVLPHAAGAYEREFGCRDLAEFETAVSFDAETYTWSDLGRPSDVYGSETRKVIREALKAGRITPKDLAEHTGLDYDLCAKNPLTYVRERGGAEGR